MSGPNWSAAERAAWAWPEDLKPSQWAERYFVLPAADNAEPGPYRNERNPLLVGIMDAFVEPGVEEIVLRKGAQIGYSTLLRILLGWSVDHEPGPTMMLLPDKKSADELFEERLKPLIEHTEQVKRHVSGRAWDVKKQSIRFDSMSVYSAWAGSSQSTKSRAIRYAFCDEVDEYPRHSGRGGDPIAKVVKRLRTYQAKRRSKLLIGSTPTDRRGNVTKHFELANEKRYAWVPCPFSDCGKYQQLEWSRIKWPSRDELQEPDRVKHAARISGEDLAYYECEHCHRPIKEAQHKSSMLRRHVWASADQVVTPDGRKVGPEPKSKKRVAFHYPAQYSPWVRWSDMAAEFILSQDDPEALMEFITQSLAEPWEESRSKTDPTIIEKKAKTLRGADNELPPLIIPEWARWLIATADTQGTTEADGYFWYVIRSWGFGERSQGIEFGVAHTKDELIARTLGRTFPMEGKPGQVAAPQGLWADTGGPRWKEVYELARVDPRVFPTKGASTRLVGMVEEKPQPKHAIVLTMIDTHRGKDQLHRLIHHSDESLWLPPASANADYCRQMSAEQKIYNPTAGEELWTEIIKNSNHLLDCETTQAAIAWRLGCWMPEPEPVAMPPAPKVNRPANMPSPNDWMR